MKAEYSALWIRNVLYADWSFSREARRRDSVSEGVGVVGSVVDIVFELVVGDVELGEEWEVESEVMIRLEKIECYTNGSP